MQEVEGSTPTGGTCPNDFSDPTDQDIRTQWALSWKIVVSEWRLVIAVSLNVGGGIRLIKPAKLHAKHFKHNEDGRMAPGVCGNGSVPLSHSGNFFTRIGIHTHYSDWIWISFRIWSKLVLEYAAWIPINTFPRICQTWSLNFLKHKKFTKIWTINQSLKI